MSSELSSMADTGSVKRSTRLAIEQVIQRCRPEGMSSRWQDLAQTKGWQISWVEDMEQELEVEWWHIPSFPRESIPDSPTSSQRKA